MVKSKRSNVASSRLRPKLTDQRRAKWNFVLTKLKEFDQTTHRYIRQKFGAYLRAKLADELSEPSISRWLQAIPTSKNDMIVVNFVETILPRELENLDFADDVRQQALKRRIISLIQAPTFEVAALAERNLGDRAAALKVLLNLSTDQISNTGYPVGRYFGYRRHSDGPIVRFTVDIKSDGQSPILFFSNRFWTMRQHWTASGFGVWLHSTAFIVAHAVSDANPSESLGLRSFELVTNDYFDWLTGPLLSVDSNRIPIAARVVLIPFEQHRATITEDEQSYIERMLRHAPTPEELDEQILLPKAVQEQYPGVTASEFIKAFIMNGPSTTLSAVPEVPSKETIAHWRDLFELHEHLAPKPRGADVLLASKALLKKVTH